MSPMPGFSAGLLTLKLSTVLVFWQMCLMLTKKIQV